MVKEIKNAKIVRAWIGYEDHRILTASLVLDYGGSGQTFSGYALDRWDTAKGRRVGTAYGCEWIIQILRTLEIGKWDELVGSIIRVEASPHQVYRIGHAFKDQWFDPTTMEVS